MQTLVTLQIHKNSQTLLPAEQQQFGRLRIPIRQLPKITPGVCSAVELPRNLPGRQQLLCSLRLKLKQRSTTALRSGNSLSLHDLQTADKNRRNQQ
jgi:hypothetical protein